MTRWQLFQRWPHQWLLFQWLLIQWLLIQWLLQHRMWLFKEWLPIQRKRPTTKTNYNNKNMCLFICLQTGCGSCSSGGRTRCCCSSGCPSSGCSCSGRSSSGCGTSSSGGRTSGCSSSGCSSSGCQSKERNLQQKMQS